jgi:hypothetical protein
VRAQSLYEEELDVPLCCFRRSLGAHPKVDRVLRQRNGTPTACR